MILYDIIENSAATWPNKIAIIDNEYGITYLQLKYFIDFQIMKLKEKNIVGENILLQFENSIEFVIAYFAISCSQNTIVLCDIKLNNELEYIIKENNIKYVYTSFLQYNTFVKKIENFNCAAQLDILLLSLQKNDFYNTEDKCNIKSAVRSAVTDIALILYTSGSTSVPKGVVNTHKNLMMALKNYTSTINTDSNDIFLGVTPFFHSYSMGSCLLTSLNCGSTLVILHKFDVKKCFESIERHRVTVFHGVPYMYNLFNKQYNKQKFDLSSVKLFISAGMKLDEDIFDTFYKLTFKTIKQEYGSSETGAILLNLSNDLDIAKSSVGSPLDGVTIMIDYMDKKEDKGTLLVQSEGCAKSYVGMSPFSNGFFRTSDIASINNDRYVFLHGRVDRLMNIAGKKIDPTEIEKILCTHSSVKDAFVYSTCENNYTIIKAQIVFNKNYEADINEIREFCNKHLALYKVPRNITICNEISESSLGKQKRCC